MKKIKLKLTPEQQISLGDMLRYVVLTAETRNYRVVENYVIAEWYAAHASRFLFVSEKPFRLKWSEACALWQVMRTFVWIKPHAGVATAILWQLDGHFAGFRREQIKNESDER